MHGRKRFPTFAIYTTSRYIIVASNTSCHRFNVPLFQSDIFTLAIIISRVTRRFYLHNYYYSTKILTTGPRVVSYTIFEYLGKL